MVKPGHIAALLLAGCLAGCGSYAMIEPDTGAGFTSSGKQPQWTNGAAAETTGAISSPTDKADGVALNSLFARAAAGKLDDPKAPAAKPVAVADA
ncbi:MAG TPA: hypothetical protein VEF90_01380, partial [Xanthobacteraceae bacterium]|nr:hypothetical protein [Xanthobacteraceae bacterium]